MQHRMTFFILVGFIVIRLNLCLYPFVLLNFPNENAPDDIIWRISLFILSHTHHQIVQYHLPLDTCRLYFVMKKCSTLSLIYNNVPTKDRFYLAIHENKNRKGHSYEYNLWNGQYQECGLFRNN